MTNEVKNDEYFISSIQCSAWLILCGFDLLRIERKGKHKTHYFTNSEQLHEYIQLFKSGEYYSPEFADAISKIKAMPVVKV